MADYTPEHRYEARSVTVPVGTLQAAPQITTLELGRVHLVSVQLVIPEGHSGQTGVAIVYDGQGILPWSFPVAFFVGDGEESIFDIGVLMGHAAQIRTYNTGLYEHTFYFRFKVRDLSLDVGGQRLGLVYVPAGVSE